jgi:hypothetical protein
MFNQQSRANGPPKPPTEFGGQYGVSLRVVAGRKTDPSPPALSPEGRGSLISVVSELEIGSISQVAEVRTATSVSPLAPPGG